MPPAEKHLDVWKWLATGLMGLVLSGGSFALGYTRVDERLTKLENKTVVLEERQAAMAERQARDAADVRERLIHMSSEMDKLVAFLLSGSLTNLK